MTWTSEADAGNEYRWRSEERVESQIRRSRLAIEIRLEDEIHTPDDRIPERIEHEISNTRVFHETSNPFCGRTRAFATIVDVDYVNERVERLRDIFDEVTFVEKAPRRFHPYGTAGYVIVSDDRIDST